VEKSGLVAEKSLVLGADGKWSGGAATVFPLLESARRVGSESAVLTRRWSEVRAAFGRS
jgi:hypothetical protein